MNQSDGASQPLAIGENPDLTLTGTAPDLHGKLGAPSTTRTRDLLLREVVSGAGRPARRQVSKPVGVSADDREPRDFLPDRAGHGHGLSWWLILSAFPAGTRAADHPGV